MLRTHSEGLAARIGDLQENARALADEIVHYEKLLTTQREEDE